jgi:hypothetical protein
MTNKLILAAAALAAATAAGAMGRRPPKTDTDAPPAQAPTEKNMTTTLEWKGQTGGPAAPGHKAINDEDEWKSLWAELGKDAPALDFKRYAAVAVFIGEKPTGGYTAVFDEPVDQDGDLLVRYRVPRPSGFTTQAFTSAWRVRAFPRPKGRIILEYSAP